MNRLDFSHKIYLFYPALVAVLVIASVIAPVGAAKAVLSVLGAGAVIAGLYIFLSPCKK